MNTELKPFDRVLVRDLNTGTWIGHIFSHINKSTNRYVCGAFSWLQCIPYEGNEELLGTNKSPKESAEITKLKASLHMGDRIEVRDSDTAEWRQAIFLRLDDDNFPFVGLCVDDDGDFYLSGWKYCRKID